MSRPDETRLTALEALHSISPECAYQDWIRIAMSAHAAGLSFDDFDSWSAGGKSYSRSASKSTWRSVERSRNKGVTAGTLFYYAKNEGWRNPRTQGVIRGVQPTQITKQLQPVTSPKQTNDGQDSVRERNRRKIDSLWNDALEITDSCLANQYLKARGIRLPPNMNCLRWIPELKYWDSESNTYTGTYPALLAAVKNAEGEILTIHRTYLSPDGSSKAKVSSPKKLMPAAGSLAGASIRLVLPLRRDSGDIALGVAEGIETALAVRQLFGIPTWSCVSASLLGKFVPPPKVTSIYIFADNDRSGTGQRVSEQLGQRLAREGYKVRVHTPDSEGDWNDVLFEGHAK